MLVVFAAEARTLKCLISTSLRSKRFLASSSRKLGREQKKERTGEGEGNETFFFFCSRSNFRAVTRLETLATQAIFRPIMISLEKGVSTCPLLVIGHVLTVDIIGSAVQKMMGGRQKHRLL